MPSPLLLPKVSCVLCISVIVSCAFSTLHDGTDRIVQIRSRKGHSALLPCYADGSTQPVVVWAKKHNSSTDPVASSYDEFIIELDELVGRARLQVTNLTIDQLRLSDSGLYTCTVVEKGRGLQLFTVQLVVTAIPSVEVDVNQSPTVDSSGFYTAARCYAKGGKPQPKVLWTNHAGEPQEFRLSTELLKDGSFDVISELRLLPGLPIDTFSVGVSKLVNESRQKYICTVKQQDLSLGKSISECVTVELLYPPAVEIELLGNRLSCLAAGNPSPAVKWILPDGGVLSNSKWLHLSESTLGDGRYACVASSVLTPSAISTIRIQRAKDLPALFRTRINLNTSIPISASGFTIDCSVDVTMVSAIFHRDQLSFEWMRNDHVIEENTETYRINTRYTRLSSTKLRIVSWLRFVDVRRDRDNAFFKCRLTNTSLTSGFATAIERTVNLTIDYPPESNDMQITTMPQSGTIQEGEDLELECNVKSKPASTFKWFFQGIPLTAARTENSGRAIVLRKVHRSQAGNYKCIAYNYVPGNAQKEIEVVVRFPPSDVVIRRSKDILSCAALSGSIPLPLYQWIFPNGTSSHGNLSRIKLPSSPRHSVGRYTCVVHNDLGVQSNASYVLDPIPKRSIGPLTVEEFWTFVAVAAFILLAVIFTLVWVLKKRHARRSAENKLQRTLKRYMEFSEPPESGVITEVVRTSIAHVQTPTSREHPTTAAATCSEIQCVDGYQKHVKEKSENSKNKARIKPVNEVNFPTNKNSLSTQGFGFRDNSVPKESLPTDEDSPHCDAVDVEETDNRSKSCANPLGRTSTTNKNEALLPETQRPILRRSASNVSAPRAFSPAEKTEGQFGYRRLQRIQSGTYPVHFFQQATFPRSCAAAFPTQYRSPLGVVRSGCDSALFGSSWYCPLPSSYPCASHLHRVRNDVEGRRSVSSVIAGNADSTVSSVPSDEHCHKAQSFRSRSMSLSASEISSTSQSSQSSPPVKKKETSHVLQDHEQAQKTPLSKPEIASPFDSGNDSAKSISSVVIAKGKKKQSSTLV